MFVCAMHLGLIFGFQTSGLSRDLISALWGLDLGFQITLLVAVTNMILCASNAFKNGKRLRLLSEAQAFSAAAPFFVRGQSNSVRRLFTW
jgi:hypothetical protein